MAHAPSVSPNWNERFPLLPSRFRWLACEKRTPHPRSCCAEAPGTRPTLREVSEKIKTIQETGVKNSGEGATTAAAAAAAGAAAVTSLTGYHSAAMAGTSQPSSIQRAPSDDLLGLFDNVQNSSSSSSTRGASAANGAAKSAQHRHNTPSGRPSPPRPPPPPPPSDTAIQTSSPTRPALPARPPPYHEALAAQGGPLLEIDGDGGRVEEKVSDGAQSGTGELVDLGQDFDRQVGGGVGGGIGNNAAGHAMGTAATAAAAGEEWWAQSAAVKPDSQAAGPAAGSNLATGGGMMIGSSNNGSISCTRSTSLAEYWAGLPGVLRAAKGGGVLSSNPRLLCVSNDSTTGAGAGGGSSPEAGGAQQQQESGGHVSVLDLWHNGRTVRYPVAADRAAMSPNQSESVIAVLGGGSLHVFSIPRRCRLQEQAVATDLCMWR